MVEGRTNIRERIFKALFKGEIFVLGDACLKSALKIRSRMFVPKLLGTNPHVDGAKMCAPMGRGGSSCQQNDVKRPPSFVHRLSWTHDCASFDRLPDGTADVVRGGADWRVVLFAPCVVSRRGDQTGVTTAGPRRAHHVRRACPVRADALFALDTACRRYSVPPWHR